MYTIKSLPEIIHQIIPSNGYFPNNSVYPLLIYRQVLTNPSLQGIQELLQKNSWHRSWII